MTKFAGNLENHLSTLTTVWRGKDGGSSLNTNELTLVSKMLLKLQRGLTGDRLLAGKDYMQDKEILGAYLLYYWPSSYMQICKAFSFLEDNPADFSGKVSILDVGSGPAPASVALCDCIKSISSVPVEFDVTLLDSSEKALSCGKKIFEKDLPDVNVRVQTASLEKGDLLAADRKFNVIVMSHALNELWKNLPPEQSAENRVRLLESLCALLSDGGLLFLCEPALLSSSRALIGAVQNLLESDTVGMSALAPCLGGGMSCPALKAGASCTCHADFIWNLPPLVKALAENAGLSREHVKMTFFILRKSGSPAESKAGCPEKQDDFVYRVVSEPMLNKGGRVRYLICDGKDRFPFSARKDDAHAREIGFFDLKRYDKILLKDAQPRGDGERAALGVSEKTKITLL